ncbi:hypothetical protein OIU76_002067 [Salix suchowensis]|uniref:Uncharacterized protein n=1 Tax=Salix suchowensis TaxID=1278906 RepID=A0ABQ9CGF4_9ROSI|nr:hypothetical protein OIU78_020316 [Salix suchowensis]KAJ6352970.1 hypothetical protein OIU76_002067 [Salix suchowensis]KAJ6398691.1 hypothetical protein OIU77_019463 [Salix suchowensis]
MMIDDGYNVVIADNCQDDSVYGLKLFGLVRIGMLFGSGLVEYPKHLNPHPSPSRQDAQRKLHEENQLDVEEVLRDDISNLLSTNHKLDSPSHQRRHLELFHLHHTPK